MYCYRIQGDLDPDLNFFFRLKTCLSNRTSMFAVPFVYISLYLQMFECVLSYQVKDNYYSARYVQSRVKCD